MSARPLIGLIGENIRLSLAPALHEDAFRALGLDGRYHLIEFAKSDRRTLAQALEAAKTIGMLGVNVTHPFKEAVLPLLDRVAGDAKRAGAANTVVFEKDGSTSGHNTDLSGFRAALSSEIDEAAVRGKSVLVLGAGGAGRAVTFALVDLGVETIHLFDPDRRRAETLAGILNEGRAKPVAMLAAPAEAAARVQGIVNASMIGMTGYAGCPLDVDLLRSDHWVGDVIYTPLKTELLAKAEKRGCRTMNGAGMCVMQAVESFRLFTGREADAPRMMRVFHEAAAARDRRLDVEAG